MPNILNLKQKESFERPLKKTKNRFEWTAPEFTQYEKSKSWFLTLGLIAAGLFIWALFAKNILFALFIGLSYFLICVYAFKKPNNLRLSISIRGIRINKTLYPLDNLKSFWIFYEPPEIKELSVRSKKTIMPYIKIPLGEQNPVEIRRFLIKYLPEKRQEESLIDNLSRQFRF